jgi:hypothetical protein
MRQDKRYRIKDTGYGIQKLNRVYYVLPLCLLFFFCCLLSAVCAADNPLDRMRDETLSYFKPVTGRITKVEDKKVTVNIGAKDAVKVGMRLNILREEAPFKHPVTKEPLGNLEAFIGRLDIKQVNPDSAEGTIIEGNVKEGDKIRISESKINMLFYQSKDTDWHLADSYYKELKDTGRVNLLDTGIDSDNLAKLIEEGKRLHAEVVLLLTSRTGESGTLLTQRLFWVSDGIKLSDTDINVSPAFAKDMKAGGKFFIPVEQEEYLRLELPSDAKYITVADIEGKGRKEIVLAAEKDIRFYTLSADLQPAHGGIKIEGSTRDAYLWLDSIDLNGNGKDEIIVTSMKGEEVFSYIYEMKDGEFVLLYKDNVFMRRMGDKLIAQSFSRADGFSGEVFTVVWDGGFKRGSSIKLPRNVNIYDFIFIDDAQAGRLVLAYDEDGFLNLYNSKEVRIWRSKTGTGGFLTTFKKSSESTLHQKTLIVDPTTMIDKGNWSVKDRLCLRNNDVLAVSRVAFLEAIRGFGFKRSEIKALWWNGLSVEENRFINNISGTIFDYAVSGDKIFVLASPMFGIKPGNILKGENPLKSEMYIFTMKGM